MAAVLACSKTLMAYVINWLYLLSSLLLMVAAGVGAYRTRRTFMILFFAAALIAFVGAVMREYSINEVASRLVEVDGEQVEQSRLLPAKQPWYRISFYIFPTAHLLAIGGSLACLWGARGRSA